MAATAGKVSSSSVKPLTSQRWTVKWLLPIVMRSGPGVPASPRSSAWMTRISFFMRPSGTGASPMVRRAVLPLPTMGTLELWRYSRHLSDQEQSAQRYQIQFWKKALYPMACLVMVALALPFAYLHARSGSISLKVFGGIMLGIAFVLLNNLAGHIGLLQGWIPWAAASAPSLLFLALSMATFAWLVRYR